MSDLMSNVWSDFVWLAQLSIRFVMIVMLMAVSALILLKLARVAFGVRCWLENLVGPKKNAKHETIAR